MSQHRTLAEIANDDVLTYTGRAVECLRSLDSLPAEDLARPAYAAGAQTFATLAVAHAVGTKSGPGYSLVEAVLATGGLQP